MGFDVVRRLSKFRHPVSTRVFERLVMRYDVLCSMSILDPDDAPDPDSDTALWSV